MSNRLLHRPRLLLPGIMPRPGVTGLTVTPGYWSYGVGGTYSIGPIPEYNAFGCDFAGGGGGGGAFTSDTGGPGTPAWGNPGGSTFVYGLGLVADGGGGGPPSDMSSYNHGAHGQAGCGSGYDTLYCGGGGAGGGTANYAAIIWNPWYGGAGGRAIKTYFRGDGQGPVVGAYYTLYVGGGGARSWYNYPWTNPGNDGNPGWATLSWS